MSGGYFEYQQYRLHDISTAITEIINKNDKEFENEFGEKYIPYSFETIKEFRKTVKLLNDAEIYLQRIDWLLSGDDGEETFHERLKEDLKNKE